MINPNAKTFNSTPTIVFIDAGVDKPQQLLQGVVPGAKVFILDQTADGIEQISQVLGRYQNIDAVHILSHGAPGCLSLGNTQLSLDTLHHYAPQLQQWNVTNLLLYGCNVAAGDAGEEFITKLHALTGSEIAASKSLTGSAAQGGNWELEVTTGKVTAPLVLQPEAMAAYPGVMAVVPEIEPNNSIAGAQVIPASSFTLDFRSDIQTFTGTNISTTVPHATINGTGDGSADYFKINVPAGQPFIFDVDGSNFDADLTLYDINGTQLASNDTASEVGNTPSTNGFGSPWINYTFSTAGDYVIRADRYLNTDQIGVGELYILHIVGVASDPVVNSAPTDLSLSPSTIDENFGPNAIVGTLTTTDPDVGDTFTYGLVAGAGDTDNAAFTLTSGGQLQINASADFETKSSYSILVRTTDAGGLTYDKPLTVSINDIDEFVYLTPNNDIFNGTAGVDQVNGGAGSDILYGKAGNDIIDGGDGNDIVYGGNDNDLINGGNGSDRLYGDAGNDTLYGETGNDILYGGGGDDLLDGGAGSDILYGNAGNDTFVLAAGMGQDIIHGFEDAKDLIKLEGGLTFGDLLISQSGANTLIKVLETGATIGTLQSINSGLIGATDFISGAPIAE